MKKYLLIAMVALGAGCAEDHHSTHHASSRSMHEILRPKPAPGVYATTTRTATKRLSYPQAGELRTYGEVDVASLSREQLPPIGEYAPQEKVHVRTSIKPDG